MTTDFPTLLRALAEHDVRCVVVGGLAATIHGSARLTQDVDIVYGRAPDNIQRLVEALAPLKPYLRGAPPGLPFDWSVATVQRGLNFTLSTTAGAIDVLGEIPGGDFDALSAHVVDVELFGVPCKALNLPTLIATKRAAGRPKDFEALSELEALLEERG